jgi:protein SCO1/2
MASRSLLNAALVAAALALAACSYGEPKVKFQAADITGVSWGRDFRLVDPTGAPRTLADYRGKVVMLFFAQYVPSFNPTFIGPSADAATIAATTKEFKAFYEAQKPGAQGFYTVDHASGIFVFDRLGRLRVFMGPNIWVDAMVHDLQLLLREAKAAESQS